MDSTSVFSEMLAPKGVLEAWTILYFLFDF